MTQKNLFSFEKSFEKGSFAVLQAFTYLYGKHRVKLILKISFRLCLELHIYVLISHI